jgi:serine/threonine protein kinase
MDRERTAASVSDGRLGGRYRLGAPIGRGGMAEVFDAYDEVLQRPVAVKRLRPEFGDDPDLRRRFAREARAAGRITHPNVVAIYDVGEQADVPYLVMERLPGRTLHDELAGGAVPARRLRVLATDILGGLGAAHRCGILHRDVKPANVLLDESDRAKVGDFGIAHVSDELHHTSTGLVLGTLSYLPPERLAGGAATAAGDLYGAGIVLFEAATGRAAFAADSPLALTHAVAHDTPRFGVEERRRLDPGFAAAVERAIAKDPADRFASADTMLAALLGDDRTDPAGAAPTAPVRTRIPPTERLVAPETTPTTRDEPDARRRRRRLLVAVAVVLAAVAVTTAAVVTGSDGSGAPTPTPSTSTPAGSTPPQLGRALDGLDRAIDR